MTERRAILGDVVVEPLDVAGVEHVHVRNVRTGGSLVLTLDEARAVAAVGIPAVLPQGERIPPERQADACAEPQTTPQRPQTPGREPLF